MICKNGFFGAVEAGPDAEWQYAAPDQQAEIARIKHGYELLLKGDEELLAIKAD